MNNCIQKNKTKQIYKTKIYRTQIDLRRADLELVIKKFPPTKSQAQMA